MHFLFSSEEAIQKKFPFYVLDDISFQHAIKVLRLKINDEVILTNGLGKKHIALIKDISKKECLVHIQQTQHIQAPKNNIHLAFSILKNTDRIEWLIEKATELGVSSITPLITERCERNKINIERLKNITIAAMLQSQQTYLPKLYPLTPIKNFLQNINPNYTTLIAFCENNDDKKNIPTALQSSNENACLIIGPEGDFSTNEIDLAIQKKCVPISLGNVRLRAETAAIYGVSIMRSIFV